MINNIKRLIKKRKNKIYDIKIHNFFYKQPTNYVFGSRKIIDLESAFTKGDIIEFRKHILEPGETIHSYSSHLLYSIVGFNNLTYTLTPSDELQRCGLIVNIVVDNKFGKFLDFMITITNVSCYPINIHSGMAVGIISLDNKNIFNNILNNIKLMPNLHDD